MPFCVRSRVCTLTTLPSGKQRRVGGGHAGAHGHAGGGRLALAVGRGLEAQRRAQARAAAGVEGFLGGIAHARDEHEEHGRDDRHDRDQSPTRQQQRRHHALAKCSNPAGSGASTPSRVSTQAALLGERADAGERGGRAGPGGAQAALGARAARRRASRSRRSRRSPPAPGRRRAPRTSAARPGRSAGTTASMRAPTPDARANCRTASARPSLRSSAARAARVARHGPGVAQARRRHLVAGDAGGVGRVVAPGAWPAPPPRRRCCR